MWNCPLTSESLKNTNKQQTKKQQQKAKSKKKKKKKRKEKKRKANKQNKTIISFNFRIWQIECIYSGYSYILSLS